MVGIMQCHRAFSRILTEYNRSGMTRPVFYYMLAFGSSKRDATMLCTKDAVRAYSYSSEKFKRKTLDFVLALPNLLEKDAFFGKYSFLLR